MEPTENPTALDGYRIVKVRKPDGTIVKVRRPITKTADTQVTSSTTIPSSNQAEPFTKNSAKSATSNTTAPSDASPNSDPVPSKISPIAAAPPVHVSKLETSARGYYLFRRLRRRGYQFASRVLSIFDPFADIDDMQSGDEAMDDDDDDDDDADSNVEDSDSIEDNQNHRSDSASQTNGDRTKSQPETTSRPVQVTRRPPGPNQERSAVSGNVINPNKGSSRETHPIQEKELPNPKHMEAAMPQSQPLRSSSLHNRREWPIMLIGWVTMILFPLLFIALVVLTATLYNRPYPSTRGTAIRRATKFAITAWPITFAAVLAQTLRAFATYRVERSIRLTALEQLLSSHSVSGALKHPFTLRRINWLTIGLLSLWSLSPLGSQAMQYTIYTTNTTEIDNLTVSYLDTVLPNIALQAIPSSAETNQAEVIDMYSDSMAAIFAAVFQPISQYQPIGSDPFGNPLIPLYEILGNETDPEGWTDIRLKDIKQDFTDNTDVYSSYYGIPLLGIYDYDGEANFTINSSYLHFDCPSIAAVTVLDLFELGLDPGSLEHTLSGSLYMNMTLPNETAFGNVVFISTCSEALIDGYATYAYASCNFSQSFIRSQVSCENTNCTVWSVMKFDNDPTSMYDFTNEFLKSSDIGLATFPSLYESKYSITELYIRNYTNATEPTLRNDYCDLPSRGALEFQKRFSYLMNTFYSTGFTQNYRMDQINTSRIRSTNSTLYWPNGTSYHHDLFTDVIGTFQYPDYRNKYRIHWPWLAIFAFCSVALLLIGLVGMLLESVSISPNILNFTSTIVRHSKYVKLPENQAKMSRYERQLALGDLKVMMQDVSGKVVLGTATETSQRLQPGRSYR